MALEPLSGLGQEMTAIMTHISNLPALRAELSEMKPSSLRKRVRSLTAAGIVSQRALEAADNATGACGYNRPCAHQYVCKSQSCMVQNDRLITHASYRSEGSLHPADLEALHRSDQGRARGRATAFIAAAHGLDAPRNARAGAGNHPTLYAPSTVCFHILRNLESMHD